MSQVTEVQFPNKKKERPNRIVDDNIKQYDLSDRETMITVLIENFPSRQELFDILEDFFDEYNMERNFKVVNKGLKAIEFLFKDLVS